jgi:hypothetical protein
MTLTSVTLRQASAHERPFHGWITRKKIYNFQLVTEHLNEGDGRAPRRGDSSFPIKSGGRTGHPVGTHGVVVVVVHDLRLTFCSGRSGAGLVRGAPPQVGLASINRGRRGFCPSVWTDPPMVENRRVGGGRLLSAEGRVRNRTSEASAGGGRFPLSPQAVDNVWLLSRVQRCGGFAAAARCRSFCAPSGICLSGGFSNARGHRSHARCS